MKRAPALFLCGILGAALVGCARKGGQPEGTQQPSRIAVGKDAEMRWSLMKRLNSLDQDKLVLSNPVAFLRNFYGLDAKRDSTGKQENYESTSNADLEACISRRTRELQELVNEAWELENTYENRRYLDSPDTPNN